MSTTDLDMRDAFFNRVYELAARDPNLVFLTADHGAFSLERFKKDLPRQYFNVGIAEQNMVGVAAGLALSGKRVFIYSIVNFVTLRCFEQLSVDLGGMKLPVIIVGVGAGFTYSTDGPTHHGVQDVAVMATIPGLSIYGCSDARNSDAFARMAYECAAPAYVRIEKGIFPHLYDENSDFAEGLSVLKGGDDIVLVASGYLVHSTLDAARQLSSEGIDAGVIDLYRIKPLNVAALGNRLRNAKAVLTIEDNVANGGIGSMVATALFESNVYPKIKRLSIGDGPCYKYGSREWIYTQKGLDAPGIRQAAHALLANKPAR